MKRRRAQATLEYIIIVTAIVAASIWAARAWYAPQIVENYENAATAMDRHVSNFYRNF